MTSVDNIKYRFIQNIGDYFPSGYFSEDFLEKVQKYVGYSKDAMDELCKPFAQLKSKYDTYKNFIVGENPRVQDAILRTHEFNTEVLKTLGYQTEGAYQQFITMDETNGEVVPVRHILHRNGNVQMLIMEMQHQIKTGEDEPDGLFQQQYDGGEATDHQRYRASQWKNVFSVPEGAKISPSVINKAVTALFLLQDEQSPKYILMLSGNIIYLFSRDKWHQGAYLEFSLDELFSQASISKFRNYFALFCILLQKNTLAADAEVTLMDNIMEESYKNAYSVTQELRNGVINAIETLANEALYYMREVVNRPFGRYIKETDSYDETDDTFEAEVKDDCITIVYRLLFIFYAESREELQILPTNDEVYNKGYSLGMLRDLEQVRLISEESRNGYFFHDSLSILFSLLASGKEPFSRSGLYDEGFKVRRIDSPLFDNKRLHHLSDVKIRNFKWQKIIQALSLSKKDGSVGRISYANLGIHQLGSVYESLLAYRGFYAEEEYIEVQDPEHTDKGQFLVPYSRIDDFQEKEIIKAEDGKINILEKDTFVYRLNGRDRQKSASFYTPEVLTRSTVKYALKAILDKVARHEMKPIELLSLKMLEPAMGAAAFQNEMINQIAIAYLQYQQEYLKKRVDPDKYQDELQKVKAYIATTNVYGVDLNPTAIELGKLSLWLNVIHKDMETPFFSNRLAVGNAVIGAWLKVYSKPDFIGKKKSAASRTYEENAWWEKAPHKIEFFSNRVNRKPNDVYHFLLPDPGMLAASRDKELKALSTEGTRIMKDKIRDWKKPISEEDFVTLSRLSKKIDVLLREYYEFQKSVNVYTASRKVLWGVPGNEEQDLSLSHYEEKELLNNTRYNEDNAYCKLKTVMDYWCSLWFWNVEDANSLPSREEYWADIEAVLDVDNKVINKVRTQSSSESQTLVVETISMPSLFDNHPVEETKIVTVPVDVQQKEEEDKPVTRLSIEEILATVKVENKLFYNSSRIRIVQKLANRYHFFHPMLDFLEVFWERGGFDLICGNPPWVKLEFDETSIMSEKFPEIVIRKTTAPEVRKARERFFNNPSMKKIFYDEFLEYLGQSAFTNATCNYHLLKGQQTNLYKCIIANGFIMINDRGFIGLLHPEGVYDDPKGQILRREIYHRLKYHFQFVNTLKLFREVLHWTIYGIHIYEARKDVIRFSSINNLFVPQTIDECLFGNIERGTGGIKVNGKWNTKGSKNRIIVYDESKLRLLAKTFDNDSDWECTKLVSIHSVEILDVLEKISNYPRHLSDADSIISSGFHETNSVDEGVLKAKTFYPNLDNYDMVYKGPQFYVCNPYYKTPQVVCNTHFDYDAIDLNCISEDYISRTNFAPNIPLAKYKKEIKGFVIGQDEHGNPIYDNWLDYYKLAFRSQLSQSGERTLICAVLPRKTAHIHAVISTAFRCVNDCVDMAAICSSLVLDFYIKTMAAGGLFPSRMQGLPFGIEKKYQSALFARVLMLNCLTKYYAELWHECWNNSYKLEMWSLEDSRLKHFQNISELWSKDTPLKNAFERRQALIEIDVITSMALSLDLYDLIMIYEVQFPVLQQNENETYYDSKGNIVFTCNTGLVGVGVDRKVWETIRDMKEGETYVHTIDPKKSELYGGQQVTYYAPFTKCDRVEDYKRAWAFFEKRFNNE